jgi:hypothetical protein
MVSPAKVSAKEWLEAHGYAQWPDGTWRRGVYEAGVRDALAEYMESVGLGFWPPPSREAVIGTPGPETRVGTNQAGRG